MNSKLFLFFSLGFLFLQFMSLAAEVYLISLFAFLLFIIFIVFYNIKKKREKYSEYDYEKEYAPAIIRGRNVAGTVFASYPENTPGLGWVL